LPNPKPWFNKAAFEETNLFAENTLSEMLAIPVMRDIGPMQMVSPAQVVESLKTELENPTPLPRPKATFMKAKTKIFPQKLSK
jgi:hypothetical protein